MVREAAHTRGKERAQEFCDAVKEGSHLFNGITDATMTHNEAWHFIQMGRMLERADKTSQMLDVKYYILLRSAADVGTPIDGLQWPPCSARPVRLRCIASGTGASNRPKSCDSCSSTPSFRAPCASA